MASAITASICRLAWTVNWPRKGPAARFAMLSHMLMNGFFFNHGLAMSLFQCFLLPGVQTSKSIPS